MRRSWRCMAALLLMIMIRVSGGCQNIRHLSVSQSEKDDADIRQAYADGRLSEKEIRLCAGRIISLINKLDKKTKK